MVVVNARMSPRSFARLKPFATLARRMLFEKITRFAVQEEEYAERYRQLGVPGEKLVVTGSVKYDGASGERNTPRTRELARLLSLREDAVVFLAGSTHAPEESVILDVFKRLREQFPKLRLILVPRHPDRFEEVAFLIEQSGLPFARRSRIASPLAEMPPVVLLDTIGELAAAWGLADLGFTGGSLDGKRGGQSMIEPAGYGVPCVFGPHIWNFKDAGAPAGGGWRRRDGTRRRSARSGTDPTDQRSFVEGANGSGGSRTGPSPTGCDRAHARVVGSIHVCGFGTKISSLIGRVRRGHLCRSGARPGRPRYPEPTQAVPSLVGRQVSSFSTQPTLESDSHSSRIGDCQTRRVLPPRRRGDGSPSDHNESGRIKSRLAPIDRSGSGRLCVRCCDLRYSIG